MVSDTDEVPDVPTTEPDIPVPTKPKRQMTPLQKAKALENLQKAREMRVSKYPKEKREAAEKKKAALDEEKLNELAEARVKAIIAQKKVDEEMQEFRAWKRQAASVEAKPAPTKKKAPPKQKKSPISNSKPKGKKEVAAPKKGRPKKMITYSESEEEDDRRYENQTIRESRWNIDDFLN